MDRPTECKWCGCGVRSYGQFTTFKCWTSVVLDNGWSQSPECKLKGLEDRIQRAIGVLKAARRFDLLRHTYMAHMDKRSDGEFLEYEQAEQALAILEGERDETT